MKHFLWAFTGAVALYAILFVGLEHRRQAKGPWEVLFGVTVSGEPKLVINQNQVGVTNATIVFTGRQTRADQKSVRFDRPFQTPFALPYGKCVFMDITSLPGSVTMQVFGHQVELMPRRTIIDGIERTWPETQLVTLQPMKN